MVARFLPVAPRFIWGLCLMPLVALTEDWTMLAVELLAAAALMLLSGKRVKPAFNLLFVLSVAAFSLLSPRGRILLELGPYRVTQAALEDGLKRGIALLCLVFVSGFSVSRGLRLPGRLGALLAEAFSAFSRLMEGRKSFDRKDWAGSIDSILFQVYDPDARETEAHGDAELGSPEAPAAPEIPRARAIAGYAGAATLWLAALWACLASRGMKLPL
jgi:hypothetical protein